MSTKEQQLQQMLRNQQKRQLSSQQQLQQKQMFLEQFTQSRMNFRKPIKNPFSDDDGQNSSQDDFDPSMTGVNPFPPKAPKTKSNLSKVQETLKWDKNQQLETQFLMKMEGQGMKDKKIRQLASKLKNLNIIYEKQKTLRKNLENQLNSIMRANQQTMISQNSGQRSNSIEKKQSLQKSSVKSQIKCSNCSQNDKIIMDMRLKNQNLKTQLNKAMRIIARQIGQDFNIDQVLNEDNGWRGRQQKIQKLKSHIRKLQQEAKNNGINISQMTGFTQVSSVTKGNPNATSMNRTSSIIAENKRKQFDNLKIQVQTFKSQNQLLQGKVKSLTSRKLILEKQLKQMKEQFEKKKQMFIEKSQNDDKFIQLLKNQNQKLKKSQRVITKVIYKDNSSQQVSQSRKQLQNFKRKPVVPSQKRSIIKQNSPSQDANTRNNLDFQQSPERQRSRKTSSKQMSKQKKKQLQDEYLKDNSKYLRKLNQNQEEQIYRTWKSSKGMN